MLFFTSDIFYLTFSPPHASSKSSLQSLPTLPFSIPQPFFNSVLLYTDTPTVLTKNPFSYRSPSANSVCDKSRMTEGGL